MSQKTPTTRLDVILLREGLVSEEQIRDALAKQKQRGGQPDRSVNGQADRARQKRMDFYHTWPQQLLF